MFRVDLNASLVTTLKPSSTAQAFAQKFRASLDWLLDVAEGAVPGQGQVVARMRVMVRSLALGRESKIAARDVKAVGFMLLAATERDLGPIWLRTGAMFPPLAHRHSSKLRSAVGQRLAVETAGDAAWALALGADDWLPLFKRFEHELHWLLHVVAGVAKKLVDPRQRVAVARVRSAVRALGAEGATTVEGQDVMVVMTLLLTALERDLGAVADRPKWRFRADSADEAVALAVTGLFGELVKRLA